MYLWAKCESLKERSSTDTSAVIHLEANGAVQSVETPGSGSKRTSNFLKMFPLDVQEKIFNDLINYRQLADHLKWRQSHPEVPPLIVFSAMPTGTATPTQPIIPMITPDAIQVERWQEYQTALAVSVFTPRISRVDILCEWQILGQSEQELYVWAKCSGFHPSDLSYLYTGSAPAVIYLGEDGTIQNVAVAGNGDFPDAYGITLRKLFPSDVLDKIFGHLIDYDSLSAHLELRRENPEEPPLIVLSATPVP